jgi:glycosyltransferase involved in cell wall biosynthesis
LTIRNNGKILSSEKKSILWVSFTILDKNAYLHKTALLSILNQLSELGYTPTLWAVRSQNASPSKQSKISVISIPMSFVPFVSPIMFGIISFFCLPIFIIANKPDFVVFEPEVYIFGSLPALITSKFTKSKLILDVRTVPVELIGFRGYLRKMWFSFSILYAKKFFSGITIITQLMKKEICDEYHLNPDTIGVWTSGVSDTLFNPKNKVSNGKDLKTKLGLTDNFVVFYHGVFTATRALREVMQAVKILKPKYPNIVFFLLGTGPTVPTLKALIERENLQGNVILHDPVDQSGVPQFIDMSDVCIVPLPNHPYWRSQSPLKLLEYLAMEKVVILTDIPAHVSVVDNQKCALYISSVDPPEIARAIEYAYNNREHLAEWGKTGREIIKNYTWESVSKDLDTYLLNLNKT